ncbi:MAG: DUF1622 domain-containing protein [Clostridia bacterium]|nr:DUF1622 domain-containing protein [Clostridia bacterium]
MDAILHNVETVFEYIIRCAVILMEIAGVVVIIYSGIRSFIAWVRKRPLARLQLAEGIAVALTFKIGGELLRTVIVRDWSELLILGAIVVLRGLITLLIQWEIKNEKRRVYDIASGERKILKEKLAKHMETPGGEEVA